MAGSVRATVTAAAVRAAMGAALTFGTVYATTITTVDDDCRAVDPPLAQDCEPGDMSAQEKAFFPALAAAFTYLLARGGFEGTRDALRQQSNAVKDSDVQAV